MKKLRILALSLILLLFASCNPIEYDMFGTIKGTVLDIDDNGAIENVYVTLSPSNKNTMTDFDGRFIFSELDAKQYSVTVQKNGYETNVQTLNVFASDTLSVTITMKKKKY